MYEHFRDALYALFLRNTDQQSETTSQTPH